MKHLFLCTCDTCIAKLEARELQTKELEQAFLKRITENNKLTINNIDKSHNVLGKEGFESLYKGVYNTQL